MPIHDYQCPDCGHSFEKLVDQGTQKAECPKCGALANKQISVPAAPVFNGTGFYQTDFKNKS